MTTKTIKITLLIILPFTFLLFSFQEKGLTVEELISERFNQRQNALLISAKSFHQALASKNVKAIKRTYDSLRLAYKRWEYLGEYKFQKLIKEQINGAPLPKIEENGFGPNIKEPIGLQVIDECMGEYPGLNIPQLLDLSHKLVETLQGLPINIRIYDYEVFEAGRIELVRVFTLGLTGFDNPGTDHALSDSKAVLEAMNADYSLFYSQLKDFDSPLKNSIQASFGSIRLE